MATDDGLLDSFAEYLAGLETDEERAQALNKAKVRAVTATPDENLGQPPVRSIKAYLADKIETPPFLVQAQVMDDEPTGQVVRGQVSLLTSPGGKGKTVLSLNRLLRWGAGLSLFEGLSDCQVPTQPLKSLIIENEGAAGFFQSRLRRMYDGYEFEPAEQALVDENVNIWGDGGWSAMKLDDPENIALLRRACEQLEPDILFLEPLRGLHRAEENSNTEMALITDELNGIASEYECAIMLTHHERKSGAGDDDPMAAVRGGGVLTDLFGTIERFRAVKAGTLRQVEWTKSRFGPAYAPVRMQFDPVRWRYDYVSLNDDATAAVSVLEENSSEWYNVADIAELTSETEDHTRKLLNSLAKDGRVKKMKNPNSEGRGSGGFIYRSTTGGNGGGGGMAID